MAETPRHGGAESGADRLRQTAEEARDAATDKLREAGDTARAAAEDARREAGAEADRGKQMGADVVHRWSSALRRAASELGEDTTDGRLVRQASDGLEDAARAIETRSLGEMVDGIADFGRRNPAAFVGGAVFAGFALSRFATASRPHEGRAGGPGQHPRPVRPPVAPASPAAPAVPPATVEPEQTGGSLAKTGPAPGESSSGGSGEGTLNLTENMRPADSGSKPATPPGTASAPTGRDAPYPSAGPVPGTGEDKKEDKR